MVPIVALVLLLSAFDGAAAELDELYESQTLVTGQREETRIPGFAECLEYVLVKVSGDGRLLGDPRVAKLAENAGSYVRAYRYRDRMEGIPHHDEQGTRDRPYFLTVTFDRARIDDALQALGRKPWTVTRPRLAVFLGMRNLTTEFMVSADGERALERESVEAAAAIRGMKMTLANQASLNGAGVTFANLLEADPSRIDAAAKALGGELPLVGRMVWNAEALAWVGTWRLGTAGKVRKWQEHSTTFDEAFRRGLGGAALILSGNSTAN